MHCNGFFKGILFTVIEVIVACGGHFVRCCQSYDCSVCACVRVCVCAYVRVCMCTGSDRKYVFMRLGFICLVLYWCHFVLSLHSFLNRCRS